MKDRDPIHVVKIGGSLLALPELGERLRDWFDEQGRRFPDAHFVAIVGGGKLVDALRDFDRLHDLGDELAHWLAIDLMEINTRVVRRAWPEVDLVSKWESLNGRLKSPGRTLFAATEFLRGVEPVEPGIRLPASWAVTSDSIAGRLAVVLGADRLILLKPWLSEGVSNRVSLPTDEEIPFVDGFFGVLRPDLPLLELVKFPIEQSTTLGGTHHRRGLLAPNIEASLCQRNVKVSSKDFKCLDEPLKPVTFRGVTTTLGSESGKI